jgi:hypothetical protein
MQFLLHNIPFQKNFLTLCNLDVLSYLFAVSLHALWTERKQGMAQLEFRTRIHHELGKAIAPQESAEEKFRQRWAPLNSRCLFPKTRSATSFTN